MDDVDDGFLRNSMTLKSSFQVTEPVGENPDEGEAAQFDEQVDTYSISDRLVDRYERYIGMVVASKTADGTLTGYNQSYPPYYQHVGRSHYGYYGAGGFWIFYGQYAVHERCVGRAPDQPAGLWRLCRHEESRPTVLRPSDRRAAHLRRERYRDGQSAASFFSEVSGQQTRFQARATSRAGSSAGRSLENDLRSTDTIGTSLWASSRSF